MCGEEEAVSEYPEYLRRDSYVLLPSLPRVPLTHLLIFHLSLGCCLLLRCSFIGLSQIPFLDFLLHIIRTAIISRNVNVSPPKKRESSFIFFLCFFLGRFFCFHVRQNNLLRQSPKSEEEEEEEEEALFCKSKKRVVESHALSLLP